MISRASSFVSTFFCRNAFKMFPLMASAAKPFPAMLMAIVSFIWFSVDRYAVNNLEAKRERVKILMCAGAVLHDATSRVDLATLLALEHYDSPRGRKGE